MIPYTPQRFILLWGVFCIYDKAALGSDKKAVTESATAIIMYLRELLYLD